MYIVLQSTYIIVWNCDITQRFLYNGKDVLGMSLRSILFGGASFVLGFLLGRSQSKRTTHTDDSTSSPTETTLTVENRSESNTAESTEEQDTEEEEDYKCTVDGCENTFETEHGRNVDEGLKH